jgi:hypothetical protein
MVHMNLGPNERSIRILIGVAVFALVWIGPENPWGYLGLIPLLTGAAGYSPLYALFRVSSCGTFHRIAKHA